MVVPEVAFVANKKDIHAIHGSWSCVFASDGSVLYYQGKFHLNDREHAQGTARYFERAKITKGYHEPLKNTDNQWLVKVWRYDNIKKFEQWERFRDLLPDVARQHMEAAEGEEIDLWRARQKETLFKPAPKRAAEHMIQRMSWEMVEVGHQPTYVAQISQPIFALQIATYLHREGYIKKPYLDRIEIEVKHRLKDKDPESNWSIRLGIDDERSAAFAEQFLSNKNHEKKYLSEEDIKHFMRLSTTQKAGGWSLSA
jgi:hypothetical protein